MWNEGFEVCKCFDDGEVVLAKLKILADGSRGKQRASQDMVRWQINLFFFQQSPILCLNLCYAMINLLLNYMFFLDLCSMDERVLKNCLCQ